MTSKRSIIARKRPLKFRVFGITVFDQFLIHASERNTYATERHEKLFNIY